MNFVDKLFSLGMEVYLKSLGKSTSLDPPSILSSMNRKLLNDLKFERAKLQLFVKAFRSNPSSDVIDCMNTLKQSITALQLEINSLKDAIKESE